MARAIHFEIPADQPERATRFYSQVFGWKIDKWAGPMDYWLVTTGSYKEPGINGAILPRQKPVTEEVNTINVASVDDFTRKVTEGGGKLVVPRMAIPEVGYFVYCQDTEGNLFGLMQSDMSAK